MSRFAAAEYLSRIAVFDDAEFLAHLAANLVDRHVAPLAMPSSINA